MTALSSARFCRPSFVLLVLLLAGCTPGKGDVSGTVTYQGKPLAGATIVFYDTANHSVSSPINADGTYAVSKVTAGNARIAILMPMNISFKGVAVPGEKPPKDGVAPKEAAPSNLPTLPAKYGNPDQSGLTYEVKTGSHTHDIPLS